MATVLVNCERGNKITESFEFVLEECCNCGTPFFITARLYRALKNDPDHWFYCPNGHKQHYSVSANQKKIDELEERLQFVKNDRQQIENELLDTITEKNKLSRQLKRVHKGTCPCCNRTFQNLQKHMETKHKDQITS